MAQTLCSNKLRATLPIIVAMIGLLLGANSVTAGPASPESVPACLDEILERVASASRLPEGLAFRQEIVFRAFLATWRFQTEVVAKADGFASQTTGAPSFVPDTLAKDLVELGQSASLFELSIVDQGVGGGVVVRGPRRGYDGVGPKEATFWIDTDHWVITRAEAAYSWGTLHVTQEYIERDGLSFLSRQNARVTPYGFTLEVDYKDYQFP